MADPKARLEEMLGTLREAGCRITPQRVAILRILAESVGHPSVEMIYERVRRNFATTSIATVYKTISLLREVGQVLELGFSDDTNRYDGNRPYPHPHVVCTRCHTIIDPDLESLTEMAAEVAQETGFHIQSHRVDFFGICPACQSSAADSRM